MRTSTLFTAVGSTALAVVALFAATTSAQQSAPVSARAQAQSLSGVSGGVDIVDVEISACFGGREWGRDGAWPNGYAGMAISTTSHNVGSVPVEWFSPGNVGETLDNRHPFIGQNMYRLRDGRLEQIGQAFIKHGFYSENVMCDNPPSGDFLGVGCFDTYDTVSNQIHLYLGPRSEINPLTGYWEPCGSHFDTGEIGYPASAPGDCVRTHGSAGHAGTDHRIGVYDQDILAADSLSDIYIEGFYIVAEDEDISNNWRHRAIEMEFSAAFNRWLFNDIGGETQTPVVEAWADEIDTALPTSEGEVLVGSRVVDLGGAYRYEYNVYNMNLDREIRSFSLPLSDGVTPLLVGFHAVPEDEETQFSMADWPHTIGPDFIKWEAPAPDTGAGEEHPNTIRYGTMYTFWFTTLEPPSPARVALEQYKPGVEDTLTAYTSAPCSLPADLNGDAIVDTADLGVLIADFGSSSPVSDLNGDGTVDTADLGILIAEFGSNCFAE